MAEQNARGGIREVTIEATVIRADGRVEELGVISSWHKNPLVRLARKLRRGNGNVRN